MGDDVDDVLRVLTIVFRSTPILTTQDFERILSFDMEWVTPHEAEQVVRALIQKGWVTETGGQIQPNVELMTAAVPLGWFPRPSRLLQPVAAQTKAQTQKIAVENVVSSTPRMAKQDASIELQPITNDPRAGVQRRLVKFIARQSGLQISELERRAKRKQDAFQLITPWLAYALVAREQGLDMQEIVAALAVV